MSNEPNTTATEIMVIYDPPLRRIRPRFAYDTIGWEGPTPSPEFTADRFIPHRRFLESRKFLPMFRKLNSLDLLPPGWDNDGAPKPERSAIAKAREATSALRNAELPPTNITPSVEGGASIYFISGDKYADIEFLNSGEILVGFADRKNEPQAYEIELSEIQSYIDRIKLFLND